MWSDVLTVSFLTVLSFRGARRSLFQLLEQDKNIISSIIQMIGDAVSMEHVQEAMISPPECLLHFFKGLLLLTWCQALLPTAC
jgi:hypothetical protein